MNRSRALLFSVCAVLGLGATAGWAQQSDGRTTRTGPDPRKRQAEAQQLPGRVIDPDQNELEHRLTVAQQLMRQRNFDAAAALLEVVREEHPTMGRVTPMLLECYSQLGHHLKSEALLTKLIATRPNNFGYRIMLAESLIQQERREEALAAYRAAAELAPPGDTLRMVSIIRSQILYGLQSEAVALIDSIRVARSMPHLFALSRGSVAEAEGRYAEAVDEYLPVLAEDTTADALDAEQRIFAMLGFVGSAEETEHALLQARDERDLSSRALRLLSIHYVRNGDFDRGFDFSIRQDSADQTRGQALVYFMRQCDERRLWDQVIRMGDVLFARYDEDSPVMIDGSFLYGEALTQVGRFDSAITVYDRTLNMSPSERDRADAAYRIGRIYADHYRDYDRALQIFDSTVSNYRRGNGFLAAVRAIPQCHIFRGDLESAMASYKNLARQRFSEDVREEVAYHIGLIELFGKQFDSADASFHKLLVDYPRGFYFNNALRHVMVISDAGEFKDLLSEYADYLYYDYRRLPDSARMKLSALVENESSVLADIALLEMARIDVQASDTARAMAELNRLIEEYPESYYMPFGLKGKADLLMAEDGMREAAATLYRRLLEHYPNYPFSSEIRETMRRLEENKIG